MSLNLPDDIFGLVFEELRLCEDFGSLFSCAQTCKTLAPLALANMYRISKISPASDEEAEGFQPINGLLVERWAVLWRSIILAGLDKTLYPYHQYLRFLDLRDLENLLDDNKFGRDIEKIFFSGSLAPFKRTVNRLTTKGSLVRLEIPEIIELVGDTLAPQSPLLEELSGKFKSQAFLKWVPALSRLQRLELWHGEVLRDQAVHEAIYKNCPKFSTLSIYHWLDVDSDRKLGKFISGLPSQSLKTLLTISSCGISNDTCAALNSHCKSLKYLQLNFRPDAVPSLALLKDCTSIENLHIEISNPLNFQQRYPEIFDGIKAWLADCKDLKEVNLTDFEPAILNPLLVSREDQLEELSINGQKKLYAMRDNREFHRSLANQKKLHTLCLRGDGDDVEQDDLRILVDSVCQLKALRKLELRGVTDLFNDEWISRLLLPLEELEEIYIGGYDVSDEVLNVVASLRNLRRITLSCLSSFTFTGLHEFISRLGPGNTGIQIAIDNARLVGLLSEQEQSSLRDLLWTKSQGGFEYNPLREHPDTSDFEGESD